MTHCNIYILREEMEELRIYKWEIIDFSNIINGLENSYIQDFIK